MLTYEDLKPLLDSIQEEAKARRALAQSFAEKENNLRGRLLGLTAGLEMALKRIERLEKRQHPDSYNPPTKLR